jgi:hypothetical protein
MKWDGSPLDEAARAVENALEEELGVRPYAVDEAEPGTLVVRYSPVDLEPAAFADAVDEIGDETEADVRAGELPARPDRAHEHDLVLLVTGLPAR